MKTKSSNSFTAKMVLSATIFFIVLGCRKDISKTDTLQSVSSSPANNDAIAVHSPYNLNVLLLGDGSKFGFVKFRQKADTAHIIDLDTWVFNLEPNRAYLLQRAVDSLKFGNCLSTAWLTLGEGSTPHAIHTDAKGNAKESLWRDVSAISPGTEFYIHFQVIDSLTAAVALTSDCYTYTVR